MNDAKVADSRDLARKIAELSPMELPVNIKVWRNNSEKVINVKLGLFPKNAEALLNGDNDDNNNSGNNKDDSKPSQTELSQLGVTLMPARTGSNQEGVAIAEVDPSSDAAEKGLKAGDVILEVSGEAVKTPDDVAAGVQAPRGPLAPVSLAGSLIPQIARLANVVILFAVIRAIVSRFAQKLRIQL